MWGCADYKAKCLSYPREKKVEEFEMNYPKIVAEAWANTGVALSHYATVIDWFHSGNLDIDTWNMYCEACLEELMKNNEKVLDKLKSM